VLLDGLGLGFWEPTVPAVVGEVVPDGPAARAGLERGDRILEVEGVAVRNFGDIVEQITRRPNSSTEIRFLRDGRERTVRVEVGSEDVGGRAVGRIRVAPPPVAYPSSMLRHTEMSVLAALGSATQQAWDLTVLQARLFWRMILGQVSLKNLSGPLSIAEFAGDSAEAGAAPFMGFLVLISLSLGFLNLLPIPVLDGGQIVFQAAEWIKGKPLSERAQAVGQQLGIALLILLMGVALFNDVARQIG
jgi:regulator of sigma E protease